MRRILLAATLALVYWILVRPWHLRWGATDEELRASMPGDDLVPQPVLESTRAITIDAPASAVWPWIAQIGQHRAGFYSYHVLENLLGCRMPDVRRIVPEWQAIAPGDRVWLHPRVSLEVVRVVPGEALVLADSWTFMVKPADERTSRLIVRGRGLYRMPDLRLAPLNFLYWRAVFEPGHFVMEQAMMRGIKQRAERLPGRVPDRPDPPTQARN